MSLNEGLLSEEKQSKPSGITYDAALQPQRRASLGREAMSYWTALRLADVSSLNEGLLSEEKQSFTRARDIAAVVLPQRRASLGREAIRRA